MASTAANKENPNFKITAAIDFGTTYSAYAFSFNYGEKEGEIILNKNWGASLGTETFKTPTCVLIQIRDGKAYFDSFGYDALEKYHQMKKDERTGGKWHLFQHFKMSLRNSEAVHGTMSIESVDGYCSDASEIIEMYLIYLKDHMLEAIKGEVPNVSEKDIRWVISVPAIWSVRAKYFMRTAALKAGLIDEDDSPQLSLSLEPEAAALYCQSIETNHFNYGPQQLSMDDQSDARFDFKTGTKFMVIDAGGGTVDITAYEISATGQLTEIMPASGGPWGGTEIDKNFEDFMTQIMGKEFIEKFAQNEAKAWLKFMLQFQTSKMGVSVKNSKGMNIKLPTSLLKAYKRASNSEQTIKDQLERISKFITYDRATLTIGYNAAKQLFNDVIQKITSHVQGLLQKPNLKDLHYIILVGGFGQCELLQKALLHEFQNKAKILMPVSPQMAVVKGSVKYGQKPEHVMSRVSKKTYGMAVFVLFVEGKHETNRRVEIDGDIKCRDSFHVLVRKGEPVTVGDVRTFKFNSTLSTQTVVDCCFYCTEKEQPMYVDEDGVEYIGYMKLSMPDTTLGKERQIETRVSFGGTEMTIEARELTRDSSETVNIVLDFLS